MSHSPPGAVRWRLGSWRARATSRPSAPSIEKLESTDPSSDGMTTAVPRKDLAMRLSAETLHDRTVISADGKAIGSIAELFISISD